MYWVVRLIMDRSVYQARITTFLVVFTIIIALSLPGCGRHCYCFRTPQAQGSTTRHAKAA